jgi:tetratricopeptide (TPR) repeat protein
MFTRESVRARSTRRRPLSTHLILSVVTVFLMSAPDGRSFGQGADPWVGARVMTRGTEAKLKIGSKVLATLTAGSVFRVDRVQGDWLWVDSGNIQGWVKKDDVVPSEQAISYFSDAIGRDPSDSHAYINRGIALYAAREYDRAIEDYGAAIKIDPKAPWPYHDRAVARYAKRDYHEALTDADEAIRLDPNEPTHLANRAGIHFALKEYGKAVADYTEAIRLLNGLEASLEDAAEEGEAGRSRGRLLVARWTCARAECWEAKQLHDSAIADYTEAVRLDPKDAATINSLAWLLATCEDPKIRDGVRAFNLASRACELTGYHNHLCLDTLAAAYAEAGDFVAAVRWQSKALELASGDRHVADGYRARMRLFTEKRPYREHASR